MNHEMQVSIQEAIHKLQQYGFQECTEAVNRQNGARYVGAFERQSDEKHVYYCCATVDDLLALLSLVEALPSS